MTANCSAFAANSILKQSCFQAHLKTYHSQELVRRDSEDLTQAKALQKQFLLVLEPLILASRESSSSMAVVQGCSQFWVTDSMQLSSVI